MKSFSFQVKTIFLSMTSTGARHRDRTTTGNVLQEEPHSGIMAYFFGEEGNRKLTVEEFVNFKRKLQQQVMRLEVGFCENDCKKLICTVLYCIILY